MANSSRDTTRSLADAIGIAGSAFCALHCLIVPLSLVIGPLANLLHVDDELFHSLLLWIVVPAATLAFAVGCLQHKDRVVMLCGAIGLASLVLSFTVLHEWAGENGERIAATFSATLLITAHVRNFRLCRSGECEHGGAHTA